MKTLAAILTFGALSLFAQNIDYSRIRNGPGVSVMAFGALGNGSQDDTAAIQATLNTGQSVLFPAGTYNVTNITLPLAGTTIRFEQGAVIHCKATNGTDCISAVSTVFALPVYRITNMSLVGPDSFGTNAAPCATTLSGHGLRISGAATAYVRIQDFTATHFCGAGKIGLWLDNVEDSTIRDITANYNDTGFVASSAFNANHVDNLQVNLNAHYGAKILNSQNSVFTALNIQSNATVGLYLDADIAMQFNGLHLENNNIAATAGLCTLLVDSATGYSISNGFFFGQYQGANEKVCFRNSGTGSGWFNQSNLFKGGLSSSLVGGFDVTGAPAQIFDGSTGVSVVTGANGSTSFLPTGNSQIQSLLPDTGSNSSPVYSFSGFPTIGVRSDGTTLMLVNGGKAVRIDSLGNVLVPSTGAIVTSVAGGTGDALGAWVCYYPTGGPSVETYTCRDQVNGRQTMQLIPGVAGNSFAIFDGMIKTVPLAFSTLPACSGNEGATRAVSDSNTAVWGAIIAGGSTNHVNAYCNGTNWTVAAK